MSSVETMTKTAELAGIIYKDMKMGADSIINLLPKVEDEKIKAHMTEQLDGLFNPFFYTDAVFMKRRA